MQLDTDQFKRLTQALTPLSAALGTTLTPEPDGQCVLRFEGPVDVIMSAVPDTELLILRSPLRPAIRGDDACLRNALEINATELPPGYFIGIDPLAEELRLIRYAAFIEAAELPRVVAEIVDMVPNLRLALGADRSQPQPHPAAPLPRNAWTISG